MEKGGNLIIFKILSNPNHPIIWDQMQLSLTGTLQKNLLKLHLILSLSFSSHSSLFLFLIYILSFSSTFCCLYMDPMINVPNSFAALWQGKKSTHSNLFKAMMYSSVLKIICLQFHKSLPWTLLLWLTVIAITLLLTIYSTKMLTVLGVMQACPKWHEKKW